MFVKQCNQLCEVEQRTTQTVNLVNDDTVDQAVLDVGSAGCSLRLNWKSVIDSNGESEIVDRERRGQF